MGAFMEDDPIAELQDAGAARQVREAIDAITADLIRNSKTYPAQVRDIPRLATSMEKSVKDGKYRDAIMRAGQLDKHVESYIPSDEPAKEAKLTMMHRLRIIAKITQ
ncbi:MAG: hypothetical protein ACRENA_07445 [Vulcanimicrobiaceae bacterium]